MDKEIYEFLERVYRNTCVLCFGDGNHPHHIVPRSAGGEDVEENLVPLCTVCHVDVHEQGAKNCAEKIRERAKIVRAAYEN